MTNTNHIARQWIEIWTNGDPATLPLAQDFTHQSPFGTITGRDRYLEIVRPLAESNVASLRVEDIIADDKRAAVLFEMTTPNGPVQCCDWLTFRGAKIQSVRSHYDPRRIPNVEPYEQ